MMLIKMNTCYKCFLCFVFTSCFIGKRTAKVAKNGAATQLMVDGKPYLVIGVENAKLSIVFAKLYFHFFSICKYKTTFMKYEVGDTVILNDEGNIEFVVLLTKDSINCNLFPKAFDYMVKKKLCNWKKGEYIRHVFEENISMAMLINVVWLFV